MARMPGTIWVGEYGSSLMQRYDIVCVHTIVGYAPAHAAHFSVKADGTIYQSRDTRYKSAANLEGNPRVIAIENEDHGVAFGEWNTSDGHAIPALTQAQIYANARILRWVHDTHGVPLQLCPDSRLTSRGLAYHRQGIDGNFDSYQYPGRVSGGEIWTKYPGKTCPGDRKISQLPRILELAIGDDGEELTMGQYEELKADIENLKATMVGNTNRILQQLVPSGDPSDDATIQERLDKLGADELDGTDGVNIGGATRHFKFVRWCHETVTKVREIHAKVMSM